MKKNKTDEITLQGKESPLSNSNLSMPVLRPKNYDQDFKRALGEWIVTFNENSAADERELVRILKTHPYNKEYCEFMFRQLRSNLEEKLDLFKVKSLTIKIK